MAKIKLKNGETIEVTDQWAEQVKSQRDNSDTKASDTIEVIQGRFEMKSMIVGFSFGAEADETPMWNLNDPMVKNKLKTFRSELDAIARDPMRALYRFEWWLVDKDYYVGAKKQVYTRPDGTKYARPEGYRVKSSINNIYQMKKALDDMLDREWYAKKQSHINTLGSDECMDKPGTGKRCEYCYPVTFEERRLVMNEATKIVPPEKAQVSLDEIETLPEESEDKEPPKLNLDKLPENKKVDVAMCEKCDRLESECICLKLKDIPF